MLECSKMQEMPVRGKAIDVSQFPREGFLYLLPSFKEEKDYCRKG